MKITPILKGNLARSCHPLGCRAFVQREIDYVKSRPVFDGPARVLVLGASSGFGLASRVALTFGAGSDTLGISFEKGPSEKGIGTAGWYNNIYFSQAARQAGRIANNIIGDAFNPSTQLQAIEEIAGTLGQVDLVIYSLATGRRDDIDTGQSYRSVLKTTEAPFGGYSVNLESETLEWLEIDHASADEVTHTTKVMGGEGWQQWIDLLQDQDLLAPGARTIAYSYLGPELTAPIYRHGTIGVAKEHLHATASHLNEQLQSSLGGSAHPVVCKALVTKASVFIPVMSVYNALLMKVMKAAGKHEQCIQQCYRLFSDKLYGAGGIRVDDQHQIRVDDWELSAEIQSQINKVYPTINADNFKQLTDFEGYKREFLQLNGFALDGVDYDSELDMASLTALNP